MTANLTTVRRIVQLMIGLFLFGIGIALMVRAELGVAPWDVLTQGIVLQTGIPFGTVTIILSVLVLLLWIPIKQKPGIGTVLNALLVGPFADFGLWAFRTPDSLIGKIAILILGIVIIGFATGLYIGARYGPGPRDGLMTGLHRVTGWPIWVVRTGIEVVVLIIGWMLGGNFFVGTVAFALFIGPLAGFFMPLLLVPAARSDDNLAG
ncbi:MAG: hypothetical protein KF680_09830 [Cryobacterium sp.]|nr:hypothetical protein [Cryobacterium sp.]